MTAAELMSQNLTDPFRIVLLIGLFYTMLRTRTVSGIWVPLAAGAVFVAILIATVMPGQTAVPLPERIGYGLVSNVIVLGVLLALWQLYSKLRG